MSTNTANFGLKRNEATDDTITALVSNQATSMNIIDGALNEISKYVASTVVGTEIRVTTSYVTNIVRFKLAANLTGATITVKRNSEPALTLKNADGTNVTALDAGYIEVVYDTSFFTLRLSGKRLTTDQTALSSSVSGTTLKLLAPKGLYDGTSVNVTITDADFTDTVIKKDVILFGKTGTFVGSSFVSNDYYIGESSLESSHNSIGESPTKKRWTLSLGGAYRLAFDVKSSGTPNNVSVVIYVNGVLQTESSVYNGASYVTRTVDFTASNGNYVEIRIKNSANGYTGYITNLKIKTLLGATKDMDIA